jgi:purine-binding chemotaxis protein CheW
VALSRAPFCPAETSDHDAILVFVLDGRDFALELAAVDRVERMVESKPLPAAPALVTGILDVGGEVVPLLDIRQRFRLPARPARSTDSIIIARTPRRRVALAVEAVVGLIELDPATILRAEEIVPGLDCVSGITRVPGRDLVLIHDLERFLSLEEERRLEDALTHA